MLVAEDIPPCSRIEVVTGEVVDEVGGSRLRKPSGEEASLVAGEPE